MLFRILTATLCLSTFSCKDPYSIVETVGILNRAIGYVNKDSEENFSDIQTAIQGLDEFSETKIEPYLFQSNSIPEELEAVSYKSFIKSLCNSKLIEMKRINEQPFNITRLTIDSSDLSIETNLDNAFNHIKKIIAYDEAVTKKDQAIDQKREALLSTLEEYLKECDFSGVLMECEDRKECSVQDKLFEILEKDEKREGKCKKIVKCLIDPFCVSSKNSFSSECENPLSISLDAIDYSSPPIDTACKNIFSSIEFYRAHAQEYLNNTKIQDSKILYDGVIKKCEESFRMYLGLLEELFGACFKEAFTKINTKVELFLKNIKTNSQPLTGNLFGEYKAMLETELKSIYKEAGLKFPEIPNRNPPGTETLEKNEYLLDLLVLTRSDDKSEKYNSLISKTNSSFYSYVALVDDREQIKKLYELFNVILSHWNNPDAKKNLFTEVMSQLNMKDSDKKKEFQVNFDEHFKRLLSLYSEILAMVPYYADLGTAGQNPLFYKNFKENFEMKTKSLKDYMEEISSKVVAIYDIPKDFMSSVTKLVNDGTEKMKEFYKNLETSIPKTELIKNKAKADLLALKTLFMKLFKDTKFLIWFPMDLYTIESSIKKIDDEGLLSDTSFVKFYIFCYRHEPTTSYRTPITQRTFRISQNAKSRKVKFGGSPSKRNIFFGLLIGSLLIFISCLLGIAFRRRNRVIRTQQSVTLTPIP